jgi:predicted hydrocarbon binding protein
MKPQVPIEVDDATGQWSVDGIPMILVPRHFFLNNHLAVEEALGRDKYADLLFHAGYKSAYTWCEKEARTHGLKGIAVFHHYMKRLSQRGWAQFEVKSVDEATGVARVHVRHSVFAAEKTGGKACYMFRGWFPGSLEFVTGKKGTLNSDELQCAAAGADYCVFETSSRRTMA